MPLAWKPVNPERHARKRTVLYGVQDAPQFVAVNASTYYLNLETVESLDFQSLVRFQSESNVTFFMVEVACYTSVVVVQYDTDDKLYFERGGVGFRIGVANWGIDFKSSSTLAMVAANAQLNLSQTAIQAQILGAGLSVLPLMQPLTNTFTFDAQTLKVVSTVGADLATYIRDNADKLVPLPLHMAPLPSVEKSDYLNAWFYSGQYSAECVYQGKSYADAMDDAPRERHADWVVPGFVRSAYSAMGIGGDHEAPDDNQKKQAERILFSGRY